jgi:hypothetical protein
MRVKPIIILSLFAAFIGLRVYALSVVTQLDSHNLDKQGLGFTIKAAKRGAIVRFEVYVQSKSEALTPSLTADLEVFDGTNQIASCAVAKAQFDKSVGYTFDVSPKYLAKSRFMFSKIAEDSGHAMPSAHVYWFYLADFVDEK